MHFSSREEGKGVEAERARRKSGKGGCGGTTRVHVEDVRIRVKIKMGRVRCILTCFDAAFG